MSTDNICLHLGKVSSPCCNSCKTNWRDILNEKDAELAALQADRDKLYFSCCTQQAKIEALEKENERLKSDAVIGDQSYQRLYENMQMIDAAIRFLDTGHGPNTTVSLALKAAEQIKALETQAAALAESLPKIIEKTIREYNLHYTKGDSDGGSYSLVDALTPPGAPNIKFGIEEMDMLVDEVLDEVEEAFKAAYRDGQKEKE